MLRKRVKTLELVLIGVSVVFLVFLSLFLRDVFSGRIILTRYIFSLKNFELRWYSVLVLSGFFVSYLLARKRAKREGVDLNQFDELVFYCVVAGVIGARVYYVMFNLDYYSKFPTEVFKVWRGGLAIHGAIFGALVTILLYNFFKQPSFTLGQILDIASWVLPLGQAIGRWGNFFNYEAFGVPTNLPWKMFVPQPYRPLLYREYEYFHPTFLYESIWNIFVFATLTLYMSSYRRRRGEVFALYLVLYSLGRMMIEKLRTDSLMVGQIRVAQLVSALLIVFGFALFLSLRSLPGDEKAS